MFIQFFRALTIIFLCFSILACAHVATVNPALERGRILFESGYYKSAMRQLFPLAINGVPPAQYAVGYMYYYGYGVPQDPEMGFLWITRAANQGYPPAVAALSMVRKDEAKEDRAERRYKIKSHRLEEKGIGADI